MELRNYSIIYDLIDDVRLAMEGRLKSGGLQICAARLLLRQKGRAT